jgi:hypothetical protein
MVASLTGESAVSLSDRPVQTGTQKHIRYRCLINGGHRTVSNGHVVRHVIMDFPWHLGSMGTGDDDATRVDNEYTQGHSI